MYKVFKVTAHPTVDFAAEELKKYLGMMMPDCDGIDIAYGSADTGLRLGLMSDLGLDTSEAEDIFLDDILHVDVDDKGNGVLAGSNPRSVLLAVYRYLQENGCRWLFPGVDGELIPIKEIGAVYYHKMADCRFRGQCNEGAEFQSNMLEVIDFCPKIGLNVFMIEFFNPRWYYDAYYNHIYNPAREKEPISDETVLQWKRQCEAEIEKRGLQLHDIGHGWTAEPFATDTRENVVIDEATAYTDEMRPYIAMTNGRRGLFQPNPHPYNTNICMSNPKAREIANRAVVDYAQKHRNVDYLHVWLADCWNNHCECDACRRKTPSDWYVMMMNELDEMLTAAGLHTRIVFICYVDTSWPPIEARLNNPRRFTLLVAPITRDYTVAVREDIEGVTYPPYKRNENELFKDGNQYVKVGFDWQKRCSVSAMLYEYHFYVHQYFDPGVLRFARVVYDDIIRYKKHGYQGLINDCSQRSYWPNGFAFYLYGQVLFDTSLQFEDLLADYFSHAYGADWREVVAIFEKIGKAVDRDYISGKRSADRSIDERYNPAVAKELAAMPQIAADCKGFLEAHRAMPHRVQALAFKLLRYYMDYCVGLAAALVPLCSGKTREAREAYEAFLADFGRRECEIETYYDQYLAAHGYLCIVFTEKEFNFPTVVG